MDSVLTFPRTVFREDHEAYRATVRRFIERECKPRQAEWDKAGRVDRETWLKAGREGLLCTGVAEEYGGAGGDFGHTAVLIEELKNLMAYLISGGDKNNKASRAGK